MSDELIERRRKELNQLLKRYNDSVARLQELRDPILRRLVSEIESFKPGDSGDKAVYLMGRLREVAAEVAGLYRFISYYEGRRAHYDRLVGRRPVDSDGSVV